MSTDTATVVAKYLTVGGATVDVTDTRIQGRYSTAQRAVHAACSGAGCTSSFTGTGHGWDDTVPYAAAAFTDALRQLNEDAQAHAETCRAMPFGGTQ